MSRRIAFLGGLGVGAGLMHALEPARRPRWPQLGGRPGDGRVPPWPDDLVAARVRAAVARAASYPHAIHVSVDHGVATLRGPVLERELAGVVRRAARVAGVRSIRSELDPHSSGADQPRLRGPAQRDRLAMERDVWPLSWRVAAGSVGLALGRIGLALARRRIRGGLVLGAGGAALAARAAANRPLRRVMHLGKASHVIELRRTVLVRAPVSEVFRFWAQVENFPLFMEHVLDVAINPHDARRSHWQVRGPAGVPVKWDAEVTRLVPDALFAWKTLPGSSVEHAGAVHFEPLGPQSTWLQVHMVYVPPGGALGQLFATVVGGDPQTRMEEDLVRLKSLLEDLHTLAPVGPSATETSPAAQR
ncbi:MAG TPA: SRPBCC family protein [Kofleriaceae bacterium]|nr:SRPBCC family protein [Kofleriaceae bacterium]